MPAIFNPGSVVMYRTIFKVFLIGALSAAAMFAIRLLIVEPDEMAKQCLGYDMSLTWQCRLRDLAIYGFSRHLYGPISLGAALLAAIGGLRAFAAGAIVVGMAGVVLYDFDLAAIGLLSGALLYLRLSAGQRRPTQQHAQPAPQ